MKRVLGKGLEALIPGAARDGKDVTISPGVNVIREILISKIKPSPFQPRLNFDRGRLQELAQSISVRGVIQPIVVRAAGEGFELIVGERRLKALELLGRERIPATVYNAISNEEAMELTLIENIQREDLNPIEEARAYHRLMTECSLTQEDVAAKVGSSRSAVANSLRLLSLPEEILQMIYAGSLSAGHARTLLGVPDDKEKIALAQKVIAGVISVRDLERSVHGLKPGKKIILKRTKVRPVEIMALEEALKRKLGTKVEIRPGRKIGKIYIEYYSNDELERLLEMLGVGLATG
jgi:ParB family chromosome partitioning protein